MRFLARTALFAALLLMGAVSSYAQVDTGSITGRVIDPTGAVVPGAQVTVTHTAMNFESVTQTNTEGMYRVQSLRPGPYRVTIVAAGFKRVVRENLELRVGDTMAVDVALEVGSVAESIAVTDAAPLLETQTSATGQVVLGDYFYSMPNYQRNVKAILWLTPGFTVNGMAYSGNMNNYHINGLRSSYIGFFEDGVLATGTANDGMTSDTIMNTIDQLKVLTTALPAEYGHSAGGAITVVKKTGANAVHGLISEFGRIRPMQHRKFFDQWRNSQSYPGHERGDTLLFQMPDANFSGPVRIPKLYDGRDKTFFMVAWQKLIEKQAKQAQYTVPTAAMKSGDFTFGGIGQQIYDPVSTRKLPNGDWTRDPFQGNIIPAARFDPVAVKILSYNPYTPPSTTGTTTTTGPSGNLFISPLKKVFWPNYSARLDQQFTPNLKSFLSYTYNKRFEISNGTTIQYRPFDSASVHSDTYQQTYSLGTTWVVNPTMVADTRLGYFRRYNDTVSPSFRQNIAGQLGIPNLPPDTFPGGLSGGVSSWGPGQPSVDMNETFSIKEDVTKVTGTHTIKFGYELMRYRGNSYSPGNLSGSFSLTSTAGLQKTGSSLANTGNSFAALLIGSVTSVSFSRNLFASHPRSWQNSFYVQDDWKVLPTLTLNLGLRYSVETPPTQKYGIISIWDPNAPDTSQYTGWTCPAPCKGAWTHPKGAKPYQTDKNNFQPRLGLAWHPIQRLVVRSGFALSTVDMKFGFLNTSEMMSDSTSISQVSGDYRPLFQISQFAGPIVYPARRADNSVPYVGTASGHSASIVDPHLHAAYTMSWNFGLQYELSRNYMLETLYSGSATVGNSGSMEINTIPWGYLAEDPVARDKWIPSGVSQYSRPWPNWGSITYVGNYGHATHHEGTVKVEKRSSRGLAFLAFYTLAKSLDGNVSNRYLSISLNKGRSDWDQRHRFEGSMTYELPIGKGRWLLNRGGVTNVLLGGWEMVWTYSILSGAPLGMGISNSPVSNTYPSWMPGYGNVILKRVPRLRDNWTDLGGDRWTLANQNSLIDCGPATATGNDCFSYIPGYERGTNGRNLWDSQRTVGASASVSKEIPIKERMRLQLRYDLQNPFKWYNWPTPSTTLSLTNPQLYGKVTPGNEATTAHLGGVPLMNVTVALRW
jgi:hypothetical protein